MVLSHGSTLPSANVVRIIPGFSVSRIGMPGPITFVVTFGGRFPCVAQDLVLFVLQYQGSWHSVWQLNDARPFGNLLKRELC